MDIFDAADGLREVPEIVSLGESGELGNVVQAYVYEASDPGPLKPGKERLRGLLGESDGENPHISWPLEAAQATRHRWRYTRCAIPESYTHPRAHPRGSGTCHFQAEQADASDGLEVQRGFPVF